VQVTAY